MNMPTEPGWYWWKPDDAPWEVVNIIWPDDFLAPHVNRMSKGPSGMAKNLGGTWGPRVPEPNDSGLAVWLVQREISGEGDTVNGIFSTREAAVQYARELVAEWASLHRCPRPPEPSYDGPTAVVWDTGSESECYAARMEILDRCL